VKIARYFIQAEWEDTGDAGFQPLWVPKSSTYNATGAVGMVHDMLEHQLRDRGLLHEEAMALGRVIYLRIENLPLNRSPHIDGLAAEFARSAFDAMQDVEPIDYVAPVEWSAEKKIEQLVEHVMQDADYPMHKTDAAHLRLWLRLGYRDACRRYPNACAASEAFVWAHNNERMFWNLAENCEPGSVLRLCWDMNAQDMRYRLIEPPFPPWLQSRVWDFHHG
jgi:hypothetical protein